MSYAQTEPHFRTLERVDYILSVLQDIGVIKSDDKIIRARSSLRLSHRRVRIIIKPQVRKMDFHFWGLSQAAMDISLPFYVMDDPEKMQAFINYIDALGVNE